MKNFLHTLPYFLLFLILLNISPSGYGQCLCSGGAPATALTYYRVIDTTDVPSTTVFFPKFDPAVGILSCVDFRDTISLISTSEVTNTASVPVSYRFLLSVTNDISGPGVGVNESTTRNYGPTVLAQSGTAGDKTIYGPDTLFKYSSHSTPASSVASYLGSSGQISFVYNVNGGLISTQGGINYTYQIVSKYWGAFSLTYYWCPNITLSTNIKNFSATKNDRSISLKWVTDNQSAGATYEIEYSFDGKTFTSAGRSAAKDPNATALQYEFQYNLPGASGGNMYFRIKQVDAQGKTSYSAVRSVNLSQNAAAGFIIYPNPVQRTVSMQFDKNLSGTYKVEITTQAGQVIYNRDMKLNNASNIRFDLATPPPSGIYYLKVTDNKTRLSFSNKLLVRR